MNHQKQTLTSAVEDPHAGQINLDFINVDEPGDLKRAELALALRQKLESAESHGNQPASPDPRPSTTA